MKCFVPIKIPQRGLYCFKGKYTNKQEKRILEKINILKFKSDFTWDVSLAGGRPYEK